jgi:hypothetical protein
MNYLGPFLEEDFLGLMPPPVRNPQEFIPMPQYVPLNRGYEQPQYYAVPSENNPSFINNYADLALYKEQLFLTDHGYVIIVPL